MIDLQEGRSCTVDSPQERSPFLRIDIIGVVTTLDAQVLARLGDVRHARDAFHDILCVRRDDVVMEDVLQIASLLFRYVLP